MVPLSIIMGYREDLYNELCNMGVIRDILSQDGVLTYLNTRKEPPKRLDELYNPRIRPGNTLFLTRGPLMLTYTTYLGVITSSREINVKAE